ncbi:hypothetical protein [Anaerovibrio sp.]|uniref:hypothetical protein n=1 Tax=Anaerovibrio sp. TaxID=1872532 RepID=UPI0025BAE6C0|nr:hypothetical protein [Anaerovibrio sp.]MBR2143159.1 hypothetical protein [Anaerovibrio sp.]
MENKWTVLSRMLGREKMYIVGRRRDPSEPLHGGNVEYAPDSRFTTDMEESEKLAKEMNKKEKKKAELAV